MVVGHKTVNLVVPILARIYYELNKIVVSIQEGLTDACFLVHYVYRWLIRYFDTYFLVFKKIVGSWMIIFFGKGRSKPFDENSTQILIHTKIMWGMNLFF